MDGTEANSTVNEQNDPDFTNNVPEFVSVKVEVDLYDQYEQNSVPINCSPPYSSRVKLEPVDDPPTVPPDSGTFQIEIEIKQEPTDYDDNITNSEQTPQDICETVYNKDSYNIMETSGLDHLKKKGLVQLNSIIKEQNHHCDFCNLTYTSEGHLKRHLRMKHITELKIEHEERRQCPHCSRFCNSLKSFDKHIKTHKDVYRNKPYKCNKCPTRFVSQTTLKTHLKKRICEKIILKKAYTCQECGKVCASKATYDSHLHRHSSVKPFKCDVCQESFKYRASIVKHVRVHMGMPKISCPSCDKMCYDKGALMLHIRTHTGEKPYKCPICDKKFSLKHTAKNHLITHQREKILICAICYKKFPKESRLKYHMQTHTKEKPFACDLCKRNFSHKQNVLRHLQRKHPETLNFVTQARKPTSRSRGHDLLNPIPIRYRIDDASFIQIGSGVQKI